MILIHGWLGSDRSSYMLSNGTALHPDGPLASAEGPIERVNSG